jgi:quinol monooxygenase YgiN
MSMKLTIEMQARPEKSQELYQTLQALLPAIHKEKGCLDCRTYRDMEEGEIFFLAVDWDSRASLERFMPSGSGGALLGAIDLLSETVKVRIGNNEPWEGIDSLKRMRKKKKTSSS